MASRNQPSDDRAKALAMGLEAVPSAVLTERQRAMLQFLDFVGRPYEDVKPGQVAMLRTMEERGLVSRGSISHRRPRWSLTQAGRRTLADVAR
jgi:DNA-binding PadR family transcriptional regulator